MAEALNELSFYDFNYTVVITEEYDKKLREAEILGHIIETDLDVISREDSRTLICNKNFSALDDETANQKIKEWLDSKVDKKEIESVFETYGVSGYLGYDAQTTELVKKNVRGLKEYTWFEGI